MTDHKGGLITLLFTLFLISCNKEFSFVQVSDPQLGFINGNKSITEDSALYVKAVEKINSLNPEAVIITGDLVHDRTNDSQWTAFRRITSLFTCKNIFVAPGNHDTGQEPSEKELSEFREMFGYDRFSFSYKKCAFIGFNSNLIKAEVPLLEEEQFSWLEKELSKASKARYTFLFCHHPMFINDPGEPEEYFNIKSDVRKKYLSLFKKYGVDAIFAGHLHKNAIARYDDIPMITTSSSGKQLGSDQPGFRLIKVTSQGFRHEYIVTGN